MLLSGILIRQVGYGVLAAGLFLFLIASIMTAYLTPPQSATEDFEKTEKGFQKKNFAALFGHADFDTFMNSLQSRQATYSQAFPLRRYG